MSSTDNSASKDPSCFSWYDRLDPSCRKCAVREACVQQQSETRPSCFAELYEVNHPECMKCLDNSQCAEEFKKMAAPKIRIKRPAAPAAVAAPEEDEVVATVEATEPVAEEAAELEDEVGPYDDLSVDDLRKELQERGLDIAGNRSKLVARLEEDDAKPASKKTAPAAKPVAVPAKPTPAAPAKAAAPAKPTTPAPAAPAAKPAPVAPTAKPTPIPQKAEVDNSDAEDLSTATIADLFAMMADGQSLILTKEGKSFILSLGGKVEASNKAAATAKEVKKSSGGLRGEAFWKETLSPEYWTWYYEDAGSGKAWGEMTVEEKVALADQLGIDNAEYAHEDARMSVMRMTEKVQEKLGIEKWKPEYATKAAREAIK